MKLNNSVGSIIPDTKLSILNSGRNVTIYGWMNILDVELDVLNKHDNNQNRDVARDHPQQKF